SVADYSTALLEPWKDNSRWFAQLDWKHNFSDSHNLRVQAYHQQFDSRLHTPICMKSLDPSLPASSGSLLFSKAMNDLFVASNNDADIAFTAMGGLGDP